MTRTVRDLPHILNKYLVEQFQIGMNEFKTTGPTQPLIVGDEISLPNRGDDAIFAVTTSERTGAAPESQTFAAPHQTRRA